MGNLELLISAFLLFIKDLSDRVISEMLPLIFFFVYSASLKELSEV